MGVLEFVSQAAFYGLVGGIAALAYANRRSLPLGWHVRIFSRYYYWRIKAMPFTSPGAKVTSSTPPILLDSIPLGKDIFAYEHVLDLKASYDDCDFFGHMSNSSYPKAMDFGRIAMSSSAFLQLSIDGGWIPLGATSFTFLKEIPIGKRYQLRMHLEAWDEKWLYVVGRFISKNKKTDEEVVHCVGVSKMCVKAGRKTIPPWLAIATSGFSSAPMGDSDVDKRTSNWQKSEALRREKGKTPLLKAFVLPNGNGNSKEQQLPQREPWMEQSYWDVEQWEQRRQEGLARLLPMTSNECLLARHH